MGVLQRMSAPLFTPAEKVKRGTTPLAMWALLALSLLAVVGLVVGAWYGLVYAGADTLQGNVQRIFYFHVATFSGAFIAFGLAVVGGIAYLRTRSALWDRISLAGVEVGFFTALITLLTGMVWARPIWNTWWTWDPRLTLMMIMMLTYAAYFMLRSAFDNNDQKRRLAAVYSVLAFITVILTLVIIRVRPDTIHPAVIGSSPVNAEGGFAMTDTMRTALSVNSIVWSCFIVPALMWWRIRLERLHDRAQYLRSQL
jgi:heme exporter protein C